MRASGSGSYTLGDAAVDGEKSDAEQERATTFLLAEDALVHGVQLAVAGRLSGASLKKLLQLALAVELDIARASPLNDRGAQPLWRHLNYTGAEQPAAQVSSLLAQYIESARKKLEAETKVKKNS